MDKRYMTVAEYAAAAGITPQAVYKQLNNKLKAFTTIIDGKKAIDRAILKQEEQPIQSTVSQNLNNVSKLVETLSRTIELLNNQLIQKDEQINQLNQRLEQALNNTSQSHYIAAQAQLTKAKPKGLLSWFKKDKTD